MMMAATRRSASSLSRRGKSPKPKKRSRKASNEDTDRDRAASRMDFGDSGRTTRLEQRPFSPASRDENERGRAESRLDFGESGERVDRSGERTSQGSEAKDSYGASKHGDVADSGIDSGNGVAEPESLVGIHRRSSSSDHVDDGHASPSPDKHHHTVPSDRSAVQKPTSDEKKDQPAVTVTVTDHSKPESPKASRKRRKSKPKRDRHSASADQFPVAAKPPLTTSSDKSAMSDSSTDTEDKESSDGSTLAGSPARSKPPPAEGKASVTEKNGDSEHSDQAVEKRKKLEARLEQAKTSLQSPHVNAAVDAFEMAEGPLVSPPNTGLMQEFRRLFQQELTRLRMELDTFRRFCSKQMSC
ncbi:uncharacterized protein [Littorina saxatilis]|uniref:uncharacterized protein n=1 Tax=Littorina saxatilis TaxID=31220 RepID=UPI0038B42F5E